MVNWINEVCEMYEVDEADVSKLKTLSGAGLNQLQRQDWIERSPNQGDLFFNLWTKLIKTSQEADVSERSKSPPASPRKGRQESFKFQNTLCWWCVVEKMCNFLDTFCIVKLYKEQDFVVL